MPEDSSQLHASVKATPALSAYERMAAACAVSGVACLVFAGWLIWLPLAPIALGAALLFAARLAVTAAMHESNSISAPVPGARLMRGRVA